jgi:hypothetical protein
MIKAGEDRGKRNFELRLLQENEKNRRDLTIFYIRRFKIRLTRKSSVTEKKHRISNF